MTTGPPVQPDRPDHYHDLQVENNATHVEIRKAYLRLSLRHHPDKLALNASDATFKRVGAFLTKELQPITTDTCRSKMLTTS